MTDPATDSPWMTTAEAAAYLRYEHPSAVRQLIQRGELEPDGRREGGVGGGVVEGV